MTETMRPGFPLRINSHLYEEKAVPAAPPPMETGGDEYLLRWGEHNSQMVNIFHQLCQENQLCDVTLSTETRSFQAHKLVLSACSPYFRQLFTSTPCKHPTVFFRVGFKL